jgi:hypothetical protein
VIEHFVGDGVPLVTEEVQPDVRPSAALFLLFDFPPPGDPPCLLQPAKDGVNGPTGEGCLGSA